MACTVILEAKAKQGTGNDLLATFKEVLPGTRSYDGCLGVDTYQSQDDSDVLIMVEKWESRAHYDKYLGWRQETGVLESLAAALESPPSIRYFDLTDA